MQAPDRQVETNLARALVTAESTAEAGVVQRFTDLAHEFTRTGNLEKSKAAARSLWGISVSRRCTTGVRTRYVQLASFARAGAVPRLSPAERQRYAEVTGVFAELVKLRDLCLIYGHGAGVFRRAALEHLDRGAGE